MKNTILFITLLCLTLFARFTLAQVKRSQLTSSIDHREPTDDLEGTVVGKAGETKRVYFFTHVTELANQQIVHRWLYEGQEKAAVALNIGGDNWRTYSSKRIPEYWQGKWQVQVWQGDSMLITHHFEVSYPN